MDKLYYIVCEEKGATLFEGKFQGRTRGMAMKFLKERIGRSSLAGTVFTITEIPVDVIREIVREVLAGNVVPLPTAAKPAEGKVVRFDAFDAHRRKDGSVDTEAFWGEIKRFYKDCRSPKKTAEKFNVNINTLKGRIRGEKW